MHHHRPWAVDGGVYDAERARAQARADAQDFVARVRERVKHGGVCVVALDTELLGHWWYEGPTWLRFVVEEAGDLLVGLDDALAEVDPAPAPDDLPVTTWGTPRDLWTWSNPGVADLAWQMRRAELDVVAAGAAAGPRAVRELLALQASDWAFLESRALAGPYARERATGHLIALRRALCGEEDDPALRNLAPYLSVAPLVGP
jgi:1,4-alpha-glucan branching enzyme